MQLQEPEYHLRRLSTTISADKIEAFIGGKWPARLTDIPGVGAATAAMLQADGVHTPSMLAAEFILGGFDPAGCLLYMRDHCAKGAHPNRITLVVLAKLAREHPVSIPPDWEDILFPPK